MAYEDLILGAILGTVLSIVGAVVVFFLENFLASHFEEKNARRRLIDTLYLEVKHNLTIAGYPDNLKLGYLDEIVSLAVKTGEINLLPGELRDRVIAYRSTLNILTQVKPVAETTLKRDGIKQMQDLLRFLGQSMDKKAQAQVARATG